MIVECPYCQARITGSTAEWPMKMKILCIGCGNLFWTREANVIQWF